MVTADQQVEAGILGSYRPPHQVFRPGLLGHQRVAHLGHHRSSVSSPSEATCCPARRDLTRPLHRRTGRWMVRERSLADRSMLAADGVQFVVGCVLEGEQSIVSTGYGQEDLIELALGRPLMAALGVLDDEDHGTRQSPSALAELAG